MYINATSRSHLPKWKCNSTPQRCREYLTIHPCRRIGGRPTPSAGNQHHVTHYGRQIREITMYWYQMQNRMLHCQLAMTSIWAVATVYHYGRWNDWRFNNTLVSGLTQIITVGHVRNTDNRKAQRSSLLPQAASDITESTPEIYSDNLLY